MKELSIQQKAKRYDEVIERARYWEKNPTVWSSDDICQKLFPELKESEDERIRKALIHLITEQDGYLTAVNGISTKDILSWLEKQGEQKSAKNIVETWKDMRLEVYQQASGNRHESNCSDDTTKMFSLNDIDEIIEKMSEQKPVIEGTFVNVDEVREGFMQEVYGALYADPTNDRANQIIDAFDHLPTITIQKPADKVKPKFKHGDIIHKIGENTIYPIKIEGITGNNGSYIGNNGKDFITIKFQDEYELIEQNSAKWSEEDEQIILSIEQVMNCASFLNIVPEKIDKIRSWLKSLKERYTWKPSNEQLKVLNEVLNFAANHETPYWHWYIFGTLKNLIKQLKKLTKE